MQPAVLDSSSSAFGVVLSLLLIWQQLEHPLHRCRLLFPDQAEIFSMCHSVPGNYTPGSGSLKQDEKQDRVWALPVSGAYGVSGRGVLGDGYMAVPATSQWKFRQAQGHFFYKMMK